MPTPVRAATPSTRRRIAVLGVWVVAVAGAAGLLLGALIVADPFVTGAWGDVVMFGILAIDALVFVTTGTVIAVRRPDNRIGWLLALTGLGIVLAFDGFLLGGWRFSVAGPNDLLAGMLGWLGSIALNPTITALGLVLVLFPDGRLPSSRWRAPVLVTVLAVLLGTLVFAVVPGQIDPSLAVNPFGVESDVVRAAIPLASAVTTLGAVATVLLGLAAVIARVARGRGVVRAQLKWLLAAVAVMAGTLVGSMVFSTSDERFGPIDYASAASLSFVPIAIAVAVLRYRLYEIDRLISRTLGWATVSAILLGVFALGLVALQTALAGVTQGEELAVAVSTLAAVGLFQPVRRRVQAVVDRRFDRTRYDAVHVVAQFGDRLRDEFELATLQDEIGRVAAETVRPERIALWVRSRAAAP